MIKQTKFLIPLLLLTATKSTLTSDPTPAPAPHKRAKADDEHIRNADKYITGARAAETNAERELKIALDLLGETDGRDHTAMSNSLGLVWQRQAAAMAAHATVVDSYKIKDELMEELALARAARRAAKRARRAER